MPWRTRQTCQTRRHSPKVISGKMWHAFDTFARVIGHFREFGASGHCLLLILHGVKRNNNLRFKSLICRLFLHSFRFQTRKIYYFWKWHFKCTIISDKTCTIVYLLMNYFEVSVFSSIKNVTYKFDIYSNKLQMYFY